MSEAAPVVPRDVDRVKGVMINSFRFSRGYGDLQSLILRFVGNYYSGAFHPGVFEAALEPTTLACHRIRTDKNLHIQDATPDADIEGTRSEVAAYLGDFERAYRGKEAADLAGLTSRLATVDWHSLEGLGVDRSTLSPLRRKYSSSIMKHAILGRPAGDRAYDSMFQAVRRALPEYLASNDMETRFMRPASELGFIAVGHMVSHPEPEVVEPITAAMSELGVTLPTRPQYDEFIHSFSR